MEWLKEGILAGMFAVLSAWHWYDKSLRDGRFQAIEKRIVDIEAISSKHQTELSVLNVELRAFSELTDVRLGHIQSGIDKVLERLERKERNE
jgi:hypothetical protein